MVKAAVIKIIKRLSLLLCLALFIIPEQALAGAETKHEIYFEGTDYELHVFEIKGEYPGNTLLIIGGMHNEPGGYLSADLYADLSLHQGNLIVVPRANFPAIVSNKRGHHSDMNRKFVNGSGKKKHSKDEYEESVVAILMELMSRSDALLNLHDGSGFYRPVWEGKMKNPLRWGQSIISDTDVHVTADGRTLNLQERIKQVIAKVNPQVSIEEHKFHHNNTRTFDKNSPHREQMGSATYYALTEHGIESYGVETSKSIKSLDLKVQYQSLIINAFMEEYNIIPRNPKVAIKEPKLEYLLVSVNGGFPYGIPNNETLKVGYGDKIRIEHIAANYERGLLADIKGLGSLNDMNKDFAVLKPHSIQVMKDQFLCGQIFVEVLPQVTQPTGIIAKKGDIRQRPSGSVTPLASIRMEPDKQNAKPTPLHIDEFLILVNNELVRIGKGETLDISPMDTLVIQDISPAYPESTPLRINFVGFVGNKKINDAEDRGYKIRPRSLWRRFSLDKNGGLYRIEALYREEPVGEMFVRILSSNKAP
ncbi:MAG: M99 family carboxypeptidase catalytic domain-containing protein [bacterium]|nr:M99 family carboxypeptidase catalytic domain-containing protein [bacterium]